MVTASDREEIQCQGPYCGHQLTTGKSQRNIEDIAVEGADLISLNINRPHDVSGLQPRPTHDNDET